MRMMDAPVKFDDLKCKMDLCAGSANDSGYCEEHDPNRVFVPSNGIGTTVFVVGIISIVAGVFSIFGSIGFGISLIVSGIAFLGFSEIINLLQKIAHVSYMQYRDNRKRIES